MEFDKCRQCGKELSHDEIGLYRKLVSRGAKDFLCIECLGAYYNLPVDVLMRRIQDFKDEGCTLFF